MKAMRDAQPKQPVEISVIAGDGKQVRIQLGGEQEDSRKQVAEAAGLKHVPLPDFDDNNGNAAWAGSLKKTPKSKMMSGRGGLTDLSCFLKKTKTFFQRRKWMERTPGLDPCAMSRGLLRTRSMMRRKTCMEEPHGWALSDMWFMTTRYKIHTYKQRIFKNII